jgi:hypothetical protein
MKKLLFASCALVIAASAALAAPQKPIDYRRTLFVPLGQEKLAFEAPRGMCFLDSTRFIEGAVTDHISAMTEKRGKEVFLATFAPCNDIANFGAAGSNLLTRGTINWAHPKIGEKSDLERQDYLDMREATLREDILADIREWSDVSKSSDQSGTVRSFMSDAAEYRMDQEPRRTENGVLMAFSTDSESDYVSYHTEGVFATTTVRRHPIEVIMLYTTKSDAAEDSAGKREEAYALVDEFLAQQIALNE